VFWPFHDKADPIRRAVRKFVANRVINLVIVRPRPPGLASFHPRRAGLYALVKASALFFNLGGRPKWK